MSRSDACAGVSITWQDVLHWLVRGLARSESLSFSADIRDGLAATPFEGLLASSVFFYIFLYFCLSHKIAAMLDIFFFLLLLFWEASKACSRHRYFFVFILSHEIAAMLDFCCDFFLEAEGLLASSVFFCDLFLSDEIVVVLDIYIYIYQYMYTYRYIFIYICRIVIMFGTDCSSSQSCV